MKFKLTAKNFMAFGKDKVVVDFSTPGITLIRGDNKTSKSKVSNGAGKSTILKALLFGLYGKLTKVTKDNLINSDVGKNCTVSVEITKEGHNAIITRNIKRDDGVDGTTFTVDGVDCRGGTERETQQNITQFVGISRESFISSVLFSAGEQFSFSGETPANQDTILTKLLCLGDLEVARVRAREKKKEVQDTIDKLHGDISGAVLVVKELNSQLGENKSVIERWEVSRTNRVNMLEQKLTVLETTHRQDKTSLDSLLEKKSILEAKFNELTPKDMLEQDYEKLLKDKELLNSKLSSLKQEIAVVSAGHKKITGKLQLARGISKEANCPACGTHLTDDALSTYVTGLLSEEVESNKMYEDLTIQQVKIKEQKIYNSNKLEQIDTVYREYDSYTRSIEKIEQKVPEIYTRLTQISKYREDISDEIDRELSLIPPLDTSQKSIEGKINTYTTRIKKIEQKIENEYEPYLSVYAFWEEGFSSSGIRNLLIESILPELNRIAQQYSETLTNGELRVIFSAQSETQSGVVKNKMTVNVSDVFGSNDYTTSSGGEQRRIDLIVSLALHSLVALRQNVGFCVMDEVFVKLDERGRRKVMELLRLLSSKIESIFVISNQSEIESELFDQTWVVERVNKSSKIIKEFV